MAGRFVELFGLGQSLSFSREDRKKFDAIMNPPPVSGSLGSRLSEAVASRDQAEDDQAIGELGEFRHLKKFLYHKATTGGYGDLPYWDDVR